MVAIQKKMQVINPLFSINTEACNNVNFRTTLWTGKNMQLTVMNIPVSGEVGLEIHDDVDQFFQVVSGFTRVYMVKTKREVSYYGTIDNSCAVVIPQKTWHNLINVGHIPLKLYSIYAPTEHPFGTVHKTKLESDLDEN